MRFILLCIVTQLLISFSASASAEIFGLHFSDNPEVTKEKLTKANIHYEHIEKPHEYFSKKLKEQGVDKKTYRGVMSYLSESTPKNPYIQFEGSLNRNPLVDYTKILFGAKNISEIRVTSEGKKDKMERVLGALISKYGDDYKYRTDKVTEHYEWNISQIKDSTIMKIKLEIIHQHINTKAIEQIQSELNSNAGDNLIRKYEEIPYIAFIKYRIIEKTIPDSEGF